MHPDGCSAVAVKPALDGEFLMFEHDFDEFELIFEFGQEGVALAGAMDPAQKELGTLGQHLCVDFTSAGNPDGLVGLQMIEYLQVAEAVHAADLSWLTTEDIGVAAGGVGDRLTRRSYAP